MRSVRLFAFVLAVILALPGISDAAPLTSVRTAWLAEYEAFAAWYAHDQKWDEENGIILEFDVFPTGKNLVDNMRYAKCDIGGCGGAAAIFGILNRQLTIIGVGADETEANAVYTRPNSPLLSRKGTNPAYPGIYGSIDTVRGKTILAPLGTSAHQLLYFWLERLGVSDTDVVVIDTKPEEALHAFAGGMGDAVVLWAPDIYKAEQLGFRRVATGKDCRITQPIFLIADRRFAEANPAVVAAFMKTYLRAVDAINRMAPDALVPLYQRFMHDFAGQSISEEVARCELATHRFVPLEEQRQILKSTADGVLHSWMTDVIRFHEATGALSHGQSKALEQIPFTIPRLVDEAEVR